MGLSASPSYQIRKHKNVVQGKNYEGAGLQHRYKKVQEEKSLTNNSLGCNIPLKHHFLCSHLDLSPENLEDISGEYYE